MFHSLAETECESIEFQIALIILAGDKELYKTRHDRERSRS